LADKNAPFAGMPVTPLVLFFFIGVASVAQNHTKLEKIQGKSMNEQLVNVERRLEKIAQKYKDEP
jgi:hypothetical protein